MNAFTSSLNELEEGVAPTDCRFQPDRRFMEQQDFNKANEEKVRVQQCTCMAMSAWKINCFHALAYNISSSINFLGKAVQIC